MRVLRGWWREKDDSLSFHRCLLPRHCKGGRYDDGEAEEDLDPEEGEITSPGEDESLNTHVPELEGVGGEYGGMWAPLPSQPALRRNHGQHAARMVSLASTSGDGDGSEICDDNRRGPLCAYCVEGYSSPTAYAECEKCPNKAASVFAVLGITFFVVLLLVLMYWVVLVSDQQVLSETEWKHRQQVEWDAYDTLFQVASAEKSSSAPTVASMSALENSEEMDGAGLGRVRKMTEVEDMTRDRAATGVAPILVKIRSKPSVTYKIKILVSFFQIVLNLAFAVDVPWPETYRKFIQVFSFFSLDFMPWQSMNCVTSFNYFARLLIVSLVPVIIFSLIIAFFFLPVKWASRFRGDENVDLEDETAQKLAKDRKLRQMWKLSLFTAFLMWPNVCSTILGMFVCKDVNGTSYIVTDMSVECYDSKWWSYVGPALFFILAYPVGVPLLFFYLLYSSKSELGEPETKLKLGFLYEAYSRDAWFFELVDMANKLILTSLLAFFPFDIQMHTALAVLTLYTIAILLIRPYNRKSDDRLHLLANAELYLFVMAGIILVFSEEKDGSMDYTTEVIASTLLIALTLSFLIVFFSIAGVSAKKMLKSFFRKRRKRIEAEEREWFERDLDKISPYDAALGVKQEIAAVEVDDDSDDEDDHGEPKAPSHMNLKFVHDSTGRLLVQSDGQHIGVVDEASGDMSIRTRGRHFQRMGSYSPSSSSMMVNPLVINQLVVQEDESSGSEEREEKEEEVALPPDSHRGSNPPPPPPLSGDSRSVSVSSRNVTMLEGNPLCEGDADREVIMDEFVDNDRAKSFSPKSPMGLERAIALPPAPPRSLASRSSASESDREEQSENK